MANRNKILIVSASTADELQEKINAKLDLLPQYRVATASSACSHYSLEVGEKSFLHVVTTIVLELIPSSEQSPNVATREMTSEEILAREA